MRDTGTDRSACYLMKKSKNFGKRVLISNLGTRFQCGEAVLEMTQIGKECHSHCEIYKRMGECIMPREGVFAIVLHGGTIRKGDLLERIE